MVDKKEIFKISLIALLVSMAVNIGDRSVGDVFDNELKDYYVCDLDENMQEFAGGISGTSYSGYPYADSRKGAIKCGTTENHGSWMPIADYAQSLGIDVYDLIEEKKVVIVGGAPASGGIQYICPPAGAPCTLVK